MASSFELKKKFFEHEQTEFLAAIPFKHGTVQSIFETLKDEEKRGRREGRVAKGGRELYRDCFDGLIREPNGKLQRPTLACWVRFIFFS